MGSDKDSAPSSTAAISAQIIDKIEDTSGIEVNNISAAIGRDGINTVTKPELNDASALESIPDLTISSTAVKIPQQNICVGLMTPGDSAMLDSIQHINDIFKNGNFSYLYSK